MLRPHQEEAVELVAHSFDEPLALLKARVMDKNGRFYRGSDAARRLSDADFAAVLAFTKAAFEMALAFRGSKPAAARVPARGKPD